MQISVRAFAWHDLLSLYRYRDQVLYLDSTLALTRGSMFDLRSVAEYFNPQRGVFTAVKMTPAGQKLIGQVRYKAGERAAHLSYLIPSEPAPLDLPSLIEALTWQAGAWGAFQALAEVEERSPAMEGLRLAGFSVYAWQRIWQFPPRSARNCASSLWREVRSIQENAVHNLQQALVPPIVQAAEPHPQKRLTGWVYEEDQEILAFVGATYGRRGIYLHPLIHPAVENAPELLASLLECQPSRANRPIYVCIRSYQAWLESTLPALEGQVAPRQALLVKRMAVAQRSPLPALQAAALQTALEKVRAEPSAPMARVQPDQ